MLVYQAVVTALLAALLLNTLNNLRLIRRPHPPGRIPHPGRWYRSWYRRATRHGPSRAA